MLFQFGSLTILLTLVKFVLSSTVNLNNHEVSIEPFIHTDGTVIGITYDAEYKRLLATPVYQSGDRNFTITEIIIQAYNSVIGDISNDALNSVVSDLLLAYDIGDYGEVQEESTQAEAAPALLD